MKKIKITTEKMVEIPIDETPTIDMTIYKLLELMECEQEISSTERNILSELVFYANYKNDIVGENLQDKYIFHWLVSYRTFECHMDETPLSDDELKAVNKFYFKALESKHFSKKVSKKHVEMVLKDEIVEFYTELEGTEPTTFDVIEIEENIENGYFDEVYKSNFIENLNLIKWVEGTEPINHRLKTLCVEVLRLGKILNNM